MTEEKDTTTTVYEVGYILVPSLSEENLGAEITKIKDGIENHKGMFISEGFPSLRTLEYTMEKRVEAKIERYSEGYFGWIKFEMDPSETEALQEELRANASIVRFILIKTVRENTLYQKPARLVKSAETKVDSDAPKMSEEELDQTIDELVIE